MLKSLSVENYALIEKTNVEWYQGFSVITGETGSGKSILLGALGLIQGARADVKTLRDESKKCVVEAEFILSDYHLEPFFQENELDYDDICVIRREIAPNGKSRAFVNDTPVALTVLRELTDSLIDIHSQHQTLLLNEELFQLHILDSLADVSIKLREYQDHYRNYTRLKRQLTELEQSIETQNSNRDYVEYQLKQLEEAAFHEGEQQELEHEVELLSHTSELKNSLSQVQWLLSGKDENVCSSLREVNGAISSVANIYDTLSSLAERVNSCLIELKDVSREVEQRLADVNVDPQKLDQMNARLDLLYSLQKKHRVDSLDALLKLKEEFEKQLSQLDSSEDSLRELKDSIEAEESVLDRLASEISSIRLSQKEPMESKVESILHELGMQNARLDVKIEPLQEFGPNGKNVVRIFFSANKNATLQPISSVASGGELSRVMLALKSILSKSEKLPTIILDEIDTGVSGEVADKMGGMMESMGDYMQVISITHLPQIASKGNVHYKVYKEDNEDSTLSHIKVLSEEDRVMEIAQMLSGATPSAAAIENAKDLLKKKK